MFFVEILRRCVILLVGLERGLVLLVVWKKVNNLNITFSTLADMNFQL